jgi:single-strand DNA-binding protein
MSINRVNISGNLTRDPELRATQGGTSILTFGVAVNDRRRNPQTGEWEDYPNYIDCVVFGNRAEPLSRFLSKGMKVAVEGKLRWSQWERDGQKRSKIEVIVDEVEFMSSRQGQQGGGYQPQGSYQPQAQPRQQAPAYSAPQPTYQQPSPSPVPAPPSADVYDEDIPF